MGQQESSIVFQAPQRQHLLLSHAQVTPAQYSPLRSGQWTEVELGQVRVSEHNPSRPPCISGRVHRLAKRPNFWLHCTACSQRLYDGGLSKKVRCSCGTVCVRDTDLCVTTTTEPASAFEEVNNFPVGEEFPELVVLSLGLFRDGVVAEFVHQGSPNFLKTFHFYIAPYFLTHARCIGVGEFFQFGDAKFKVLGAMPSYGVVTQTTLISCPTLLYMEPVQKMQLCSIEDSRITQEDFDGAIAPYFKGKWRHAHPDQLLYINGKQYIVSAVSPADGLITSETEIYFEGETMPLLSHVNLAPYIDCLPYQLQCLARSLLKEEIMDSYIMPHFQGFRRCLSKGQTIVIHGVNFKVEHCSPEFGVTADFTVFVYDGSMFRREFEYFQNQLPVPITMTDPLVALARQRIQLQELVGEGAPSGTDDITIHTLPTHVVDKIPSDPEASKCMICMTVYRIGDVVRTLPCFHLYHTECIDEWLLRSKLCPVCKLSVDMN